MNKAVTSGKNPANSPLPKLSTGRGQLLQRKCACGGSLGLSEECEECAKKKLTIQRKAKDHNGGGLAVPPVVTDVLNSAGQPLNVDTRHLMETRIGHDFSKVRVHTDEKAAQSARSVNALAYTSGHHVVFASGQYSPDTRTGQKIIAHELTHVVQQSGQRPNLNALSVDHSEHSPYEQEADIVSEAVVSNRGPINISKQAGAQIQRLPGSKAGGCGLCYGQTNLVGIEAHAIISTAMKFQYPWLQAPFYIPGLMPNPTKAKGLPDLGAIKKGLNTVVIGEIKPNNPKNIKLGNDKLDWYERQLTRMGFSVERMMHPPPLVGLPFPTLAPPDCLQFQDLLVDAPVNGLYTYWCIPDFKELIVECDCNLGLRRPKDVKEEEKEKVKEKKKEKDKDKEKEKEKDKDKGKPIIQPDLIPVAVMTALMAALLAAAAKKAGTRALGPAMVVLAIILVANGAEASVGLEGDDAIDAMIKMSKSKGIDIPDDLKEAIKKDPELKRIMTQAAQTGDASDAQRQLGEQLTRTIVENRDQFSDEELEAILKLSEGSQGSIPNGKVTVEAIKKALKESKDRQSGSGSGNSSSGGSGTGGNAGGVKKEGSDTAQPPGNKPKEETPLPPSAKRLVDGVLKKDGKGPKIDAAGIERLRQIAVGVNPPLTDAEVDALLAKVASAEGKSVDEVLNSISQGINTLRQPAAKDGPKGANEASQGDDAKKPENASKDDKKQNAGGNQGAFKAPIEDPNKNKPKPTKEDQDVGKEYAKALASGRYNFLNAGEAALLYKKDTVFKINQAFDGYMAARGRDGTLCVGSVIVTPKSQNQKIWTITIHGGSKLYDSNGSVYSTTKNGDVTITPN